MIIIIVIIIIMIIIIVINVKCFYQQQVIEEFNRQKVMLVVSVKIKGTFSHLK